MVQGVDPPNPGVAEAEFGQGSEQEVPLDPIERFFEIQQEEDQLLVALHNPVQGVLGYEDVVKDAPALDKDCLVGPDDAWEEGLQPPGEHLGQNFVHAPQEGDRSPIPEFGAITRFGNQSDKSPIDVGRGLSRG